MPVGVSAYVPLANVTLGAASNLVTFSSISQDYRDLVLVMQAVASGPGSQQVFARINGISSNGYFFQMAIGSSNVALTGSNNTSAFISGNSSLLRTDSIYMSVSYLHDYSVAGKLKTILTRGVNPTQSTNIVLNYLESTTAAITTLTLFPGSNSFAAGATFALYGVSA